MNIWPEFQRDLERYKDTVLSIKRNIRSYEECIESLIHQIGCSDFESSKALFDELFNIQSELTTMLYKYEYEPEKRIRDLIYLLNRDDFYSRMYWYEKFSDGMKWPE
ncbi:hypothetical protein BHZ80_15310 [Salmonella enterica]|nr:hypothetical protein [Salmonella enterica]EAA9596271.1 hypothetical protein [Salmonella enterica]EAO9638061.1 hypothetical protein [Salmonella enterica]EBQ4753270.1 hypothetical protein [Salmonella enterica subsp. diarizonae]